MDVLQAPAYRQGYSVDSRSRNDKKVPAYGAGTQGYDSSPAYTIALSPDALKNLVPFEDVLKAMGGYSKRVDPKDFVPTTPKMQEYDDELNAVFSHKGYSPKESGIISYLYRTEADNAIDQGYAAMDDLNEKLVAIDSKLWKKSELAEYNLSNAARSLINSLEKSTGKYVVSQNQGIYDIKFGYAGEMCDIGINMLEFMAQNRQNDDIWENIVEGKYQNLGEIDAALRNKGDIETADKLREQTAITVTPSDERVKTMIHRKSILENWQNNGVGLIGMRNPDKISDDEIQNYKKDYIEKNDPYKRQFINGDYLWSSVAPYGTEEIVKQYNQYDRR